MEQGGGHQHGTETTEVGTESVMEHLNWECVQPGLVALMFGVFRSGGSAASSAGANWHDHGAKVSSARPWSESG
jgi:hypothetical protein